MRTIVSKFGGSSTANAARLRRILSLLRDSPARRCVVLSAPGIDAGHGEKVTALLERCWYERDADRLEATLSRVCDRFSRLAADLGLPGLGDLPRREITAALGISLSHTLSRGEYLCALLFSRFSGLPMADAAGLIAFDEYGALDAEATQERFDAAGRRFERMVVPGFYGADAGGSIRTFPRNGSDISGALAAAGLGAGLYENWTDVPGLMTADPAVVPEARLIPQVSYRQMRALARAGARVLHPGCLDPVEMAGIPTRLRCLDRPECFGTLIDERFDETVPCVAGRPDEPLPDGSAAARVSVFGVPEAQVLAAARGLQPVAIQRRRERVDVFVPAGAYERAVRRLHGALIPPRKDPAAD